MEKITEFEKDLKTSKNNFQEMEENIRDLKYMVNQINKDLKDEPDRGEVERLIRTKGEHLSDIRDFEMDLYELCYNIRILKKKISEEIN